MRQRFEAHIASSTIPRGVPGAINAEGGLIRVACLGHTVTAVPRAVFVDREFAIEYAFVGLLSDEQHVVWRCYLVSGTKYQLSNTPTGSATSICDWDNHQAAGYIVQQVGLKLLDSPLLAPSRDPARPADLVR